MAAATEEAIRENEQALAGFAAGSVESASPALQRVLDEMRRTGLACYAWPHLKALLLDRLRVALEQMQAAENARSPAVSQRCKGIVQLLDTFEGPPFTLQRLTEVILEPQKSYRNLNKLINALEKLLAVSSTIQVVDPRAVHLLQPASPVSPPTAPGSSDPALETPAPAEAALGGDVVAHAPWSNGVGTDATS